MDLDKIIICDMPNILDLKQLDLIKQHIEEISKKEIVIKSKIKEAYPNIKATNRKIIISKESFFLNSYRGFIRYIVKDFKDFNDNARIDPAFSIAEKEFEYKI